MVDSFDKVRAFKLTQSELEVQTIFSDDVIKVSAARTALIESTCEQSLTDEQKRGVLVVENFFQNLFEVRLDSRVPYGHIYIAQKESDVERFVSREE